MALGTSRAGVLADATLVDRTRHQTALRLLPFLFVLYIVNYLDRTSVAYAAIGMSRDLGFSDRVFGLGVGVFLSVTWRCRFRGRCWRRTGARGER